MELWKKYIKEREGADIIYNDYGFVTYRNLNDSEIMIIDVFVDKEYRKTGAVQKLYEAAAARGLHAGVVRTRARGARCAAGLSCV